MKPLPPSEMEAVQAAGAALILILLFAIYVRFFPTPVSFMFGYGNEGFSGTKSYSPTYKSVESFTAATMEKPATGTPRQTAPSHNL